MAEPQRRIARHGTLAGDDLADAIRRHVDLAILAALGVVLLASPLLWASPAGESAAADDGRLTLWFMKTDNGRPLPAEVHMNDNPWTQVLAEGLPHIDITWLLIPEETFAEQKNIMIAAGDIPDMFPVSHNEMPKWADSGLSRPLDDLVAEHYPGHLGQRIPYVRLLQRTAVPSAGAAEQPRQPTGPAAAQGLAGQAGPGSTGVAG